MNREDNRREEEKATFERNGRERGRRMCQWQPSRKPFAGVPDRLISPCLLILLCNCCTAVNETRKEGIASVYIERREMKKLMEGIRGK